MRKTILAGISGLIALSAGAITTPTLSELQQLEKEGKALKMNRPIATRPVNGTRMLPTRQEEGIFSVSGKTNRHSNPLRSPQKLTEKGTNLYGYISYTLGEDLSGMYEFTEDGYKLFWEDPMVAAGGPQAMMGWYIDDLYWGISYTSIWGYMVNYDEFVIDFETAELLSYESHLFDTKVMFVNVALNPDDDKVYGFAFDYSIDGEIYWASAYRDEISNATSLRFANDFYCYALAFNPEDGYFYGVTDEQKFIRISTDGNYIVIADLSGYGFSEYVTGMVYSREVNGFYWAPYFENDTSALAIISLTGNIEFLQEYSWGPNFTALINTDEYEVNPDMPGRPEIDEINFNGSSLKGTVEFTLPERLLTGAKFPDNTLLSYTAMLDNSFYSKGTGKPGDHVTIEYDVKTKGYHTFGLTATYNRVSGYTAEHEVWIGNDTPFAPTGIKLSQTEVSWNPVISTGIHGGYVNPEQVTYNVYINGNPAGTTKSTSMEIELPKDEPFTAYIASVTAEFDGLESNLGYSNYVGSGEALSLPFFMQPTPEQFRLFTVLDENNDGITWEYNTTNAGISVSPSSLGTKVNDYVFLPPIDFPETDNYFNISFQAACWMTVSTHYDYLEVVWATEPEADMVGGVILPAFTPLLGQFEIKDVYWKAPQPGSYYIGFRCISEADQNGMVLKNFEISESAVSGNSPAAPEIVSAMEGDDGSLSAEITLKLPVKTFEGENLKESEDLTAHILVNGIEGATVSGKPGETVKAVVETVQGNNTIEAYLSAGELESPKVRTSVITGVAVPANPKNTRMQLFNMMSALLTWDPVTESYEEGGYVDPAGIRYAVYLSRNYGFGDEWMILADEIKGTSFTLNLKEGDPQAVYRLGVASYNEAGTSGYFTAPKGQIMGTTYTLPFVENLENSNRVFDTAPWLMETNYNGESYSAYWATDYMPSIGYPELGSDPVVLGFTDTNFSKGLLSMPRFTTAGVPGAKLSMTCLTGENIAKLTVYGNALGQEDWIEIGSIDASKGLSESLDIYTLELPEILMGRDWVQLYLLAEYTNSNQIFAFTNLEITATSGVNETLAMAGSITAGENVINVYGHEGDTVTVTSIEGRLISHTVADSGIYALNVGKGVYVVTAGQQTVKVIVR